MRHFNSVLFLGNCQPHSSEAQILKLQRLLQDAIELSGGLQQPAHSTSEESAKENERDRRRGLQQLDHAVKDIAMALTGKEYVVKQ